MDFIKTTGMLSCIMLFCIGMAHTNLFAKDYSFLSRIKKIKVTISVEQDITYSVQYENKEIIKPSQISMELEDGVILGKNSRVNKQKKSVLMKKSFLLLPTKTVLFTIFITS